MKFEETPLKGAYRIDLEKREDERGFFSRLYCKKEFSELNLTTSFVQINNSFNLDKGTLRGMHYQLSPDAEVKMIRCLKGSIFDMALDLRPDSSTYGKSFGLELNDHNRTMFYIPEGFAHGFITLEESTEIIYFSSSFYSPDSERGIKFDDKSFNWNWPLQPSVVSDKDKSWPDFDREYHGIEKLKGLI